NQSQPEAARSEGSTRRRRCGSRRHDTGRARQIRARRKREIREAHQAVGSKGDGLRAGDERRVKDGTRSSTLSTRLSTHAPRSRMRLTAEERAILAGARGEPVKRALELQLAVGRFYGAKRFVPVSNVHMMGDIEVMGDGGLEYLRHLAGQNARCEVAITTNARCFDFAHIERLGQDAGEAAKERKLIGY